MRPTPTDADAAVTVVTGVILLLVGFSLPAYICALLLDGVFQKIEK